MKYFFLAALPVLAWFFLSQKDPVIQAEKIKDVPVSQKNPVTLANKAMKEKKWHVAISFWEQVLLEKKGTFRLVFLEKLAYCHRQTNKLEESLKIWEEAHQIQPDNLDYTFQVALTQSWLGLHQEARQLFGEILEKKPTYLDAHLALTRLNAWDKKYVEALQTVNQILEKQPNHQEALSLKKQILVWSKSPNQASRSELINQAEKLVKNKYFAKAIPLWKKNLEFKEGLSRLPLLEKLAHCYHQTNELEEALRVWEEAHQIQPDNLDYTFKAALTQSWLGSYQEARQLLNVILEVQPEHLDVHLALARLDAWDKKYTEALWAVNQILEKQPSHQEALSLKKQIFKWSQQTNK